MAENKPQRPAEDVPYLVPQTWAELMENQRVKHGMRNNEFARFLTVGDKKITSSRYSRWLAGETPSPDLVIHVCVRLGLPATLGLALTGQADLANYIIQVAGRKGPRAAALEPLLAQIEEITEDQPEENVRQAKQNLLEAATDWFVAAEAQASAFRKRGDGDSDTDDRGAS
jgi:transcriptional regulator with XRE-family HTH domain